MTDTAALRRLIVVAAALLLVASCKEDDGVPASSPTAAVSATAAASSTPAATATRPAATATATATFGPVIAAPTQPAGVPPRLAVPPAVTAPEAALGASGAIQGLYTYPSEGIPPQLQACALNLANQQVTCTGEHRVVTDHRGISGEGYRLVLPPGQYHAYVEYPGSRLPRAYYNEFVLCGFHVACQSHAKIALTVAPGVLINGVLLGDWYEQ